MIAVADLQAGSRSSTTGTGSWQGRHGWYAVGSTGGIVHALRSNHHSCGANLRVAQTVARTSAEGPGERYAVWVQGCPLRCPGCCNPEMLALDRGGRVVPVRELAEAILATDGIEGLTLAGGEPVAQAAACAELAEAVQGAGLSVMLFSGYTLEELRALGAEDPEVPRLLGAVDLLVDGPYLQQQPETRRRWIGSANQVLHALTRRYDPSAPAFLEPNTVEIRLDGLELVVNGWPAGAHKVRSND